MCDIAPVGVGSLRAAVGGSRPAGEGSHSVQTWQWWQQQCKQADIHVNRTQTVTSLACIQHSHMLPPLIVKQNSMHASVMRPSEAACLRSVYILSVYILTQPGWHVLENRLIGMNVTHVWGWVSSLGWVTPWLLLWWVSTGLLWGVPPLGRGVGTWCCRRVPPRLLLWGVGTAWCAIAVLGRGVAPRLLLLLGRVAVLLLWGVAALRAR
jgi:hypothetical protein